MSDPIDNKTPDISPSGAAMSKLQDLVRVPTPKQKEDYDKMLKDNGVVVMPDGGLIYTDRKKPADPTAPNPGYKNFTKDASGPGR